MPRPAAPSASVRPAAAELNTSIRQFSRSRAFWSPEALAELARMRAAWAAAVAADAERDAA